MIGLDIFSSCTFKAINNAIIFINKSDEKKNSTDKKTLLSLFLSVCVYDANLPLGFCVAEAHHESLFCVDELDSLFSYFNTSAKPRSCKYSGLGHPAPS